MLTEVKNQIKVSLLSIKYGLQREMLNKVTFFSNIIFMILNNAAFLVQWLILFSLKDNIGGYGIKQVILLWGLASGTFGVAHFFFKEAFNLSEDINTGKLDNYLIQPKNVLLSLITSSVEVSAIGDLLYAYIMLFLYGITLKNYILFTFFCIVGGIIMVCLTVITASLSFWFGKVELLSHTLNTFITSFSTYPEGIFKGFIKVIFYTLIPIGFISYLPVNILTTFHYTKILIVLGVTLLSIVLTFIVFYKGLKKYSSSNLMNVRI